MAELTAERTETHGGILCDPDFDLYRQILTDFMKSMQLDAECVFRWLRDGIEAGGELAFMTAMMACGDYDKNVHPRHIMHDLWHAYDRAEEQIKGMKFDSPEAMCAMRAAVAIPRVPCTENDAVMAL